MGGGSYSTVNRSIRAEVEGYASRSMDEIFQTREHNWKQKGMNPADAQFREARDSQEHPIAVPIIFALDVTGSMLEIPKHLIAEGLPTIMATTMQLGVRDPQLMFVAIGDHETDKAPLQVGQFESSDKLLDKWLTSVYPEGNGGGNAGESYLLAWYYAAMHTATDHWDKRQKKGFLFTIGDEPTLHNLPGYALDEIMGPGQRKDYTAAELLSMAQEKWHVYHFHVTEGSKGQWQATMDQWSQLLGEGLVIVDDHRDVPVLMAEIIARVEGQPIEVGDKLSGDVDPTRLEEDDEENML